MNIGTARVLCVLTLFVILGPGMISVQDIHPGAVLFEAADGSTVGPTTVDPLLELDKPSDEGSLLDFLELLNSRGGVLSDSDFVETRFYSDLGNGLHLHFELDGNVLTIEAFIGSYSIVGHSFEEGHFSSVLVSGCQMSTDAGTPALPYRNIVLRVPTGASIQDVSARVVESESMLGLTVVPSPRPLALYNNEVNDETLYFDEQIYAMDSFTKANVSSYDTLQKGDDSGILLSVYPLRYNPGEKRGELALKTEIKVVFDRDVAADELLFPSPAYAGADPGNYTIIARQSFLSSLSSFVAWKTSLGFEVFVETLEDILTQYPTGDGPTKVRDYITDSYNENSTDYVLLVGDCDIIPVREVVDPADGPGLDNGTEPSDLYYECLDGTWDANENGQYGELSDGVDFMPELMVGRLPVQTAEQARSVLAQIVRYEQNPESGDWINDFVLIANDCFGTGDGPVMVEGFLNQKYLYDSFFDVFRYYSSDSSLTTPNIVSKIDSGAGVVDFFDHGAYDQWSGALYTGDVESLTNGNKTMLAFAMACETAAFDVEDVEPTISEAFFRNADGGAHTYIGATRVAWAGYDCFDGFHNAYWAAFLETAIELGEVSPKVAMQEALEFMYTTYDIGSASTLETIYQAIYFGDPSLRMYWKHDVSVTAEPTEVETTTDVNATCLLYNGQSPIVGPVDVTIIDPLGTVAYDSTVTTDSNGQYTLSFDTSSVPGVYTIWNEFDTPFAYRATETFLVGTMDVSVALAAEPVYNTFLGFSGSVSSDCSGTARLLAPDHTVLQDASISSSGGTFSSSLNVTGFGDLILQIEFDNGTATGGAQLVFRVNRGDVLVISDDTGSYGPEYPGGWADSNVGDSSNPADFVVALQDEYNVSVFQAMYQASPSLELLNQYDAVVVTTGDCVGMPLVSPDSYLLDVLYEYADGGGDIVYEGCALFTALSTDLRPILSNMASVEYVDQIVNSGSLSLAKASHPIMSGLPSTIPLSAGLGTLYAEVVTPTNGSQTVGSYSGEYVGASAITAVSAGETRGGVVFIGFSIDAIANEDYRSLLIQNAIAFLLHPSLLVSLSDDALQTGTTETIEIFVEDSATGSPVGGAHVIFEGCGVSASNDTLLDGTCSIEISPTYEGQIHMEATKGGYLNYTTEVIVYDTPVVSIEAFPPYLERSGAQGVTVLAKDFYERFPLDGCFINLTGLGNSLSGYTNESGMIDLLVTPTSPGVITITGNYTGYINATITLPVRISVLVLPGIGTYAPELCCWDELMLNWRNYGNYPLEIDYTTFANFTLPVTLDLLETLGPQVLIAELPLEPYMPEEVAAIQMYVQTGAGLVGTSGLMYYNTPEWSTFYGLEELSSMTLYYPESIRLDITSPDHPVMTDVPDPYVSAYPWSIYPESGEWSGDVLQGASYIALEQSTSPHAAVLTYRGMVYLSNIPEYMANSGDCQILYNSMTWTEYVMPEHDLAATLDIPSGIGPGGSGTITVTGRNLGLNNETDIDLSLYINGSLVATENIPELDVGATYNLEYLWTPIEEAIYNITAFMSIKPGEENELNNVATRLYIVRELHNYNMFEGPFTWLDAKENGVGLGLYGDDTYASIALPFSFPYYDYIFDSVAVSSNGWLSFAVTDPYECSPVPYPSSNYRYAYALAPIWGDLIAEGNVYVWSTPDWVAIQYDSYRYLGGQSLGTFELVLNSDGRIGFYYLSMGTVFYGTVGLNYGDGVFSNSFESSELSGVQGFGLEFYYAPPEHEIALSVSCRSWVGVGETVPVDLTVFNLGIYDEYDLDLQLFIEGTAVFSTAIAVAEAGESYDYSYSWDVPSIGTWNLTACVTQVPDELTYSNNRIERTVESSQLRDYTMLEDTYEWLDAVANGDNLYMSGDDVYDVVSLPFDFYFYDITFDTLALSSNAWFSFVTMAPWDCSPVAYPDSDPRYAYSFAPIWADLQAENNVYVWSTSEFVVIQFENYKYLGGEPIGTFEAVLYASGVIAFNYEDMDTVYYGTVGLNYGDGIHCNTYMPDDLTGESGFGLRFVYDDGTAPEWVEVPSDFTEEAGEIFYHTFEVYDDSGIARFTTNDSRFVVSTQGVMHNTEGLHVGEYGLHLVASDPGEYSVSANITVTIDDTNGPSWDVPLMIREITSGDPLEVDVRAYDFSGVSGYQVNRSGFAVNTSGYLHNTVSLSPGVYSVGVIAADAYGNENTLSVLVTVRQSQDQAFLTLVIISFAAVASVGFVILLVARKVLRSRGT